VRPFKPQNMSNNAAVTPDGGEIGRAQALQARACGVPPTVHMNPVLLKPQTEVGAQLVVQGKVRGAFKARDYTALKPQLMAPVLESYEKLGREADLILVEGAGSPAEVNLRQGDIANMGFAEAAGLPVMLVGDIDRGGVIAALVGTYALLEPAEQQRLRGYLINKFRGDPGLFDDAHPVIAARTGMRSYGVVPWFERAHLLPAEDALDLEHRSSPGSGQRTGAIKIAVPRLQRAANFDDLDPLAAEPDVALRIVPPGEPLPGDADLVLLTGSKATIADLQNFRTQGWDIDLAGHVRRGGAVLGICGGFPMLGRRLADPEGIEGAPGETAGLGLLDFETVLGGDKQLLAVRGQEVRSGLPIHGYEMHIGRSQGPALAAPMLNLGGRTDGAVSADGRIAGC
jgi:adenosylcobyric acid synthase